MATGDPLKANAQMKTDYNLSSLLEKKFENGMTGRESIEKMKQLMTDKGTWPPSKESVPDDWEEAVLMRFFIGFKKNCEAAAEAFASMLAWRETHGVNEIRKKILGGLVPEQFPRYTAVRRFYPLLKTGVDSNGCPIMITLTGLIDPAKLVKAVTLEEIRLYIIYEMEHKLIQLSQLTAETGILYRALEIHDLKGLGMHHLAAGPIQLLRKVVTEVSANYVEMADKVLILNCPFASVVRGVLKQVVPARSQHKLAVMGDQKEYEKILKDHADVSQYHPCLFGGALPEGLEDSEDEMASWPTVNVAARDKKVVSQEMKQGQTLMWAACPESMDVGLEIKFVGANGKTELIFSDTERVSTLKRGSYNCEQDGTVQMSLDNTYSFLKGKVVIYNFELLQQELGSKDGDAE